MAIGDKMRKAVEEQYLRMHPPDPDAHIVRDAAPDPVADPVPDARPDPPKRAAAEPPPPTPAPGAALTPDLIAALMGGMGTEMAKSIATALEGLTASQATATAEAIKGARSRRPESYNGDFEYHGRSVFSPDGSPLPRLKCDMFLGIWDETQNKAIPVYPYVADETGGLDRIERDLLNAIEPGAYLVERRDEVVDAVRVDVQKDTDGTWRRLIIAVPNVWLTKEHYRSLPSVKKLAGQLQPGTAKCLAT